MMAIKMDPMDEEPDVNMVPNLSTAAKDYDLKRDTIRCFPATERRAISLETSDGVDSANRALRLLGLRMDLEGVTFLLLFRYLKRARKLNESADEPVNDGSLVRAHNYLSGHIKATKHKLYEEA